MTSRLVSLIVAVVLSVVCVATDATDVMSVQEVRTAFCGRVIDMSCTGPSSPVTLLLADARTSSNRQVVIPAEYRYLFGTRIEDRYDQQMVCVESAAASVAENTHVLVVRDPGDIVVKGPGQASITLPDDVARTCDPDMRMPILTRDIKPQYTADAMRAKIHGSVFLRGIVDRDGTVRDVHVVQALEPSLDAAARDAVAQWQFRPAMRGNEPVAIAISVQMAFTLK